MSKLQVGDKVRLNDDAVRALQWRGIRYGVVTSVCTHHVRIRFDGQAGEIALGNHWLDRVEDAKESEVTQYFVRTMKHGDEYWEESVFTDLDEASEAYDKAVADRNNYRVVLRRISSEVLGSV